MVPCCVYVCKCVFLSVVLLTTILSYNAAYEQALGLQMLEK